MITTTCHPLILSLSLSLCVLFVVLVCVCGKQAHRGPRFDARLSECVCAVRMRVAHGQIVTLRNDSRQGETFFRAQSKSVFPELQSHVRKGTLFKGLFCERDVAI